MASLKTLLKDTAIYGMSSIIGRFLNYFLVPLYTIKLAASSGGYGVITNVYAYTALLMVILTFGMETTFFRFANKEGEEPMRVYSTTLGFVGLLSAAFFALVMIFLGPISGFMGYQDHPEWIWVMALTVSIDAFKCIPFDYLRFRKRPYKFAILQLLNIALNIALNIVYFVILDGKDVSYAFYINLFCTVFVTLCMFHELTGFQWMIDTKLLRRMFSYSWPILILGIAGILNQTADKILFPHIYDGPYPLKQLGIYGAASKIAMIMAMITQAFRFAYEPIVFAGAKDRNSKEMYAKAMKFFLIFTLLAFLAVVGYMDILKHLIGQDYWDGLRIVPIVMMAEIMMGIYFNLSFWYKLIDKTIWGAWFSLAGCAVLILVNIIFVPQYSYVACAWGGVAGYGTAMTLSYFVGQHYNPINYPLRSMMSYTLMALAFFILMTRMPDEWPVAMRLALNTVMLLLFVGHVWYHEFKRRRV